MVLSWLTPNILRVAYTTLQKMKTAIKNCLCGILSRRVIFLHDYSHPQVAMVYKGLLRLDVKPQNLPCIVLISYYYHELLKKSLKEKSSANKNEVRSAVEKPVKYSRMFLRSLYSQSRGPLGCLFQLSQQLCLVFMFRIHHSLCTIYTTLRTLKSQIDSCLTFI